MRVVLDYLPTEIADVASLRTQLREEGFEVVLALEEIDLSLPIESQVSALAKSADCFVIAWSQTAASLFGINHVATAKDAAQRVFNVGPDKLVVWSMSGALVPFELSDLPLAGSKDELLALLRARRAERKAVKMLSVNGRYFEPHQDRKIFLSHSSQDWECGKNLVSLLEPDNEVWFASRDMRGPGLYGNAILSAIMGCERFLLLLTFNSVRSPHCIREVYLTIEEQKPISVLSELRSDQLTADWRYPLAGIQLNEAKCGELVAANLQPILH